MVYDMSNYMAFFYEFFESTNSKGIFILQKKSFLNLVHIQLNICVFSDLLSRLEALVISNRMVTHTCFHTFTCLMFPTTF